MLNKKHKRKVSRIIIFTTDAVDADMKQIRIRPWVFTTFVVLICCLLGGIIGYAVYETQLWQLEKDKDVLLEGSMGELEAEIAQLKDELLLKENEIAIRDEKIEALSSAFNAQSDEMDALKNELSQQSLPSDYPLTGSAGIEESNEGDPMVIFSAEEGITVTPAGIVIFARLVQSLKVPLAISVTPNGIFISVKLVHPKKEPPIFVSLSGN